MILTKLHRLPFAAVVVAAALLSACFDAPVAPEGRATHLPPVSSNMFRAADISACPQLVVPLESKVALHVYAAGVQIYRWTGSSWGLYGPDATLSADAAGNGVIGTHYVGPTWETVSGSKVVGAVVERCQPNPNAIPWLLLRAVSAEGPGPLQRVTHIHRVNTVGGNAPSTAGTFVGQEVRVAYTTEYFFYRAK